MTQLRTKIALSLSAAALALPAPAAAWGPTGHRVAAEIAEHNIDGLTRAKIEEIIGDAETLEEGSTWPDDERSNPDEFWQKTASPWHYVTLPEGKSAEQLAHPPEGDAATALEKFTATLRDPKARKDEKALALRFVVHIVADLHNPFHAGNGTDRGANDVIVKWFDNPAPTNLHWVWDEGMILRQQLSFSEYAARLERHITPEQVVQWWNADPLVWIDESATLRDGLYPATGPEVGMGTKESPVRLSWNYSYNHTPLVEERLSMAGIRVAAYLDWVFAGEPAGNHHPGGSPDLPQASRLSD